MYGKSKLTVLLIEDDLIAAELLGQWLSRLEALSYLGNIRTFRDGFHSQNEPDVVILDLQLADGSGLDVIAALRSYSNVKLLVLIGFLKEHLLYRLSVQNLDGVVLKSDQTRLALIEALEAIGSGRSYYSPEFIDKLADFKNTTSTFPHKLCAHDIDLLPLLARGYSNQEIANRKGLAASTVQSHRRDIMRKLRIHRTPHLMEWARSKGFLDYQIPADTQLPLRHNLMNLKQLA